MQRIIIYADGTWNEPEKRDDKTGGIYPTNVLKVARAVREIWFKGISASQVQ